MSVLNSIKLDDIEVELVKPLNGLGIVGRLQTKEIADGVYVQILAPIYYQPTNGNDKNGVDESVDLATMKTIAESVNSDETAKAAGLVKFDARWNIKPEWLTPKFSQLLRQGEVDAKEKIMFQMNVAGITRGLFKALNLPATDFSAVPEGAVVGFKASASKKEPDRRQIRLFFAPRSK